MSDIYTQENGSKKKFLAPVLVILLCMVSLTAAGYAYSATVDNTGDDVIVDGITMDFSADEPIFHVDNLHIGTHVTNGKAVWYNGEVGFKSDVVESYTKGTSVAAYDDGYYVEVELGTASGFFTDAQREAITFANDETPATKAAAGIYQIGSTQTLTVVNGTDGNATVAATITTDGSLFTGIKGVFLIVRDSTGAVVAKETLADGPTNFTVNTGATGVYSIEVYLAISDYKEPTSVPTIPNTPYNFVVSFEATA